MQYFSLLAHVGDRPGRPCAMLQGATLDRAAEKARHIVRDEGLPFVERTASFTLRRSTRRETELLQRYLASCTGARLALHAEEDLDGLMARRNRLLMSFFAILYLDPHALRRRLDTSAPIPSESGAADGGTGSGGVVHDKEQEQDSPAAQDARAPESPVDESAQVTQEAGVSAAPGHDADSVAAPVGAGNQIDVLEGIMSGAKAPDPPEEVDIFP